MTDKQSEALRLADALHKRMALRYMGNCKCGSCQLVSADDVQDAAAELRRLDALNAELVEALTWALAGIRFDPIDQPLAHKLWADAKAALAKAEGK